jgi:hypothetical protein
MQPQAFAIETEGLSKHGTGVVQASNGSIAQVHLGARWQVVAYLVIPLR